jgi:hypothetical protein
MKKAMNLIVFKAVFGLLWISGAMAADPFIKPVLDPSFGTNGQVLLSLDSLGDDEPRTISMISGTDTASSRILIGANAHSGLKAKLGFTLVRLLPDGALDGSFAQGGALWLVASSNRDEHLEFVQALPEGKFLLGGFAQAELAQSLKPLLLTRTLDSSLSFTETKFELDTNVITRSRFSPLTENNSFGFVLQNAFAFLVNGDGTRNVSFGSSRRVAALFGRLATVLDVAFTSDGGQLLLGSSLETPCTAMIQEFEHPDPCQFSFQLPSLAKIEKTGELNESIGTNGKVTIPEARGFIPHRLVARTDDKFWVIGLEKGRMLGLVLVDSSGDPIEAKKDQVVRMSAFGEKGDIGRPILLANNTMVVPVSRGFDGYWLNYFDSNGQLLKTLDLHEALGDVSVKAIHFLSESRMLVLAKTLTGKTLLVRVSTP